MNGFEAEKLLERAHIILNRNLIPKDYRLKTDYRAPSGIRIGVQEVTRLGMGKGEMIEIAELIKKVLVDRKPPEEVAKEVVELRKDFQHVKYAFTSETEAYEHVPIR